MDSKGENDKTMRKSLKGDSKKMTKVKCSVHDCKHQTGEGCDLEEIELVYSCGRSTDYDDVLYCRQYEFENKVKKK